MHFVHLVKVMSFYSVHVGVTLAIIGAQNMQNLAELNVITQQYW